jgi:hypothetical protein
MTDVPTTQPVKLLTTSYQLITLHSVEVCLCLARVSKIAKQEDSRCSNRVSSKRDVMGGGGRICPSATVRRVVGCGEPVKCKEVKLHPFPQTFILTHEGRAVRPCALPTWNKWMSTTMTYGSGQTAVLENTSPSHKLASRSGYIHSHWMIRGAVNTTSQQLLYQA